MKKNRFKSDNKNNRHTKSAVTYSKNGAMKKIILVTLMAFFSITTGKAENAGGSDLVFLGVLGNDAPILEKAFDMRLREALSVNVDYHLQDYLTSQDFRRRINFDDFPTVSRRLVESLKQFSNDSTVFIWVTVKDHSVKPQRKLLVKASAHGKLLLTVSVYSLRFRDYAFIGDVSVDFDKPEGFVFFDDIDRDLHISATDRQEIIEQLVDSAAYKSANLISAVMKSEKSHFAVPTDSTTISKYKASSISDMFNVPSVEAANVERAKKQNSRSAVPSVSTPASSQDKNANPSGGSDKAAKTGSASQSQNAPAGAKKN